MEIINLAHVTLHKEAQEMIDQAELAGWQKACVTLLSGDKYPSVAFWMDDIDNLAVNAHTVPGFTRYSVRCDGETLIEFKYNVKMLTPAQAQSTQRFLRNIQTQHLGPHVTAKPAPNGGWIGYYDDRPVTEPVSDYQQARNLAWDEMHGNDRG